jgi:hypothetical protein
VKDYKPAYVRYRLERAHAAIEEAEMMLQPEHIPASINRQYYACFYAVSALLLCKGFRPSKHTHVRGLLHRELVKPGIIDTAYGEHYDELYDNRQKADYGERIEFGEERVSGWLGKTKEFVDRVELLVKDCLAERRTDS